MPAFASGEDGYPPAIARVISSLKAARTPQVGGGVDQPGGMQAQRGAEERAPEHHAQAAGDAVPFRSNGGSEAQLKEANHSERQPMELRKPNLSLVAGKVRNVAAEQGSLGVERATGDDPAHVRPPCAIVWGMRVAVLIRVLVVNAMGRHPEDRPTLKRQGAAGGEEVLQPLGNAVPAMRQQAVVAHADATLIAKKYVMTAAATFFQEKKNRAAMAPMWKTIIKLVVIQLTRPSSYSRPKPRSCLIFFAVCSASFRRSLVSCCVSDALTELGSKGIRTALIRTIKPRVPLRVVSSTNI